MIMHTPQLALLSLSQGMEALVDDDDFMFLNQYKWSAQEKGRVTYAIRTIKKPGGKTKERTTMYMHRLIASRFKIPEMYTHFDHVNSDGTNNRRCNIRPCTHEQNNWSARPHQGAQSPYKGVSQGKSTKTWRAQIRLHGRLRHIGTYDTQVEAAMAYDKKAWELHGQFAYINFPNLLPPECTRHRITTLHDFEFAG